MPVRKGANKRKGRRSKSQSSQSSVLKDIRLSIQEQSNYARPMVPDQQVMKMAKRRICTVTLFSETVSLVANTNPVTAGVAFLLNQFAGYSDYLQCFDQYRILQIVVTFIPKGPATAFTMGSLLGTCFDYDDSNTPASMTQLEQYETYMVVNVGTFFQRVFRPRIAYAAYAGAFTSYANQKAGWIDSNSPAVSHFGLKYYMTPGSSGVGVYDVRAQAIVQFRSQI